MARHAFKSLAEILRASLDLRGLAAGQHVVDGLRAQWTELLPGALGRHSRPLWYRDGRLLVEADSPAWATRLRFQQQTLYQRLRRSGACPDLRELRIRVAGASQGVSRQRRS